MFGRKRTYSEEADYWYNKKCDYEEEHGKNWSNIYSDLENNEYSLEKNAEENEYICLGEIIESGPEVSIESVPEVSIKPIFQIQENVTSENKDPICYFCGKHIIECKGD